MIETSSSSSVLAYDHALRKRALDPSRSVIVQAPAGSGKTGLLIRRYLTLLALAERPEEVLVITFTRKAAEELRTRVLSAMDVGTSSATHADDAAHDEELRALAASAMRHGEARGWALAEDPTRLAIHTIDGLCARLARRMPWLAGLGGALAVEAAPEPLYRRAARALIAYLDEEGEHAAAVAVLLEHLDGDLARFERLLVELLAHREQWWQLLPVAVGDGDSLRRLLEDGLSRAACHAIEMARQALPAHLLTELGALAREIGDAHAGSVTSFALLADLDPACTVASVEELPRWQALAELLLTAKGELRASAPKREALEAFDAGHAKHLRARTRPLFEALHKARTLAPALKVVASFPSHRYEQAEWTLLQALLHVLKLALAELTIVFAEEGRGDFAALAEAAIEALGEPEHPTDLALRLDYRIGHVLVDEFQDTSLTHLRLLVHLTAGFSHGDGRSLFLVGDPMQSIYRFRQAEVGQFLNCMRQGLAGIPLEPVALSANFRSRPELVAWINETFAQVFPARDDAARSAVSFAQSHAMRDADTRAGVHVHPFIDDDGRAQAERVVEIVQALRARSQETSIAILARSRNHLPQVLSALERAGLSYRGIDLKPLRDVAVVRDLHALTSALAHPMDRVAWLSVLRAPWCGLSLPALDRLLQGDSSTPMVQLLADGARLAKLTPSDRTRALRVHDALAAATPERVLRRWKRQVEAVWLALGAPACYPADALEDARAYFTLMDAAEAESDPMSAIAERMRALYAHPVSGTVDVEVMTLHKAKGLEFDHVILPRLERRSSTGDRRLLLWSEMPLADGHAVALSGLPGRGEDRRRHAFLGALEEDKRVHEECRLLYVGCTRARESLHLLAGVGSRRGGGVQAPHPGSLLARLWPAVAGHFDVDTAPRGEDVAGDRAPPWVSYLERVEDAWRVPLPRTPPSSVGVAAWTLPVDAVQFDWAGRLARHVGAIVHAELAHIAAEGPSEWPRARIERRRGHYHAQLAALGIERDLLDEATARVVASLTRTLEDRRGCWLLDARHEDAGSELVLAGQVDGRVTRVVLDRTFVDAGVRWIVDYKTGEHIGSGLDEFLDREQCRYRGQLERYARFMAQLDPHPIRLGLYFPIMGGWREWVPGTL